MRFLLLFISALAISRAAQLETLRFDQAVPGEVPMDWTVAMTHAGAPPQWEIVRDESAPSPPNVLAQLSRDTTAGRFPLAIWKKAMVQDGYVRILFKTVEGSIDQAAGIVWRYQDPKNYYIVRANALENNVVFYKVEDGVRTSVAPRGLPSVPTASSTRFRVVVGTTSKSVSKALRLPFSSMRSSYSKPEDATFSKPGKVGLWTKADSVTYFDDFSVLSKEARR